MIAATNPCPSGYYGSHEKYCTGGDKARLKYMQKITGPIIDRVDFVLEMKNQGVLAQSTAVTSEELRKLTASARARQRIRYGANYTNAIVPIKLFEEKTQFTPAQLARIESVSFQEKLSSRSTMKILRLARTISDLSGNDEVTDSAVNEALEWKISASRTHSSLMR